MNLNYVFECVKWVALLFVVGGALTTSLRIDPLNIYLFNMGALLYIVWATRAKDWNIATVNGVLLLIYVYGAIIS